MGLLSTIGAASGRAFGFTRSAIAAATDAFFNRVTLLLPGNGTNGAQNNTFLDSSTNNFTITRNGNTTQGTFSPFSQTGWSNFFDGSGDYLSNTSTALITNAVSTFTVESWVYFTATPPASGNFISSFCTLDGQPTGPTNYLSFGPLNDGKLYLFWFDGSVKYAAGGTALALNTWYHIACVVNSNAIQFYVNGVAETMSGTTTLTNRSGSQGNFAVGSSSAGQITGYISNFRVTTTAVYTSAFTPSTTALTNITNTKLLTCQSNRFVDNSSNAYTLTVNGTPSVQAFSPFAPTAAYSAATVGGSGYFDGSGDFLNFTASISITGQFAAECWFYRLGSAAQQTLFAFNSNSSSYASVRVDTDQGNVDRNLTVNLSTTGSSWAGTFSVNSIYNKNAWNHFVVTRDASNNIRLFLNGVLINTVSAVAGTLTSASTTQALGCNTLPGTATNTFNGYISDIRLVNGSIPTTYQTSSTTTNAVIFTPPSAPMTTNSQGATSSNVSLLTNFTNAGITDATAKNVLETVGNAQISTTQSKFGGSSMYFDGTGDALFIPPDQKENLRFGTGNFTIEFWAWKSANGSSGFDCVISIGTDGNFNGGFALELSASRGFVFIADAASRVSSNFNPNDSTWHHYAVVRNGNNIALYRDGVQLATAAFSLTLGISGNAFVGAGASSTQINFNGYIDDLRVTRGVARYTANFTPPTAAFALQ